MIKSIIGEMSHDYYIVLVVCTNCNNGIYNTVLLLLATRYDGWIPDPLPAIVLFFGIILTIGILTPAIMIHVDALNTFQAISSTVAIVIILVGSLAVLFDNSNANQSIFIWFALAAVSFMFGFYSVHIDTPVGAAATIIYGLLTLMEMFLSMSADFGFKDFNAQRVVTILIMFVCGLGGCYFGTIF